MKLNGKQIGIILVSLVLAFIVNWVLWLLIMKHPENISFMYQALVTICLGAAFVHVGDRLTNAGIFK